MFKYQDILGFCVTLALVMAGFSDVHASLVIDTFDEGGQLVPPASDIATSSAIGGRRFMDADGVATGAVDGGFFSAVNGAPPGGVVAAAWNGGGTLGGVDLTAGGDFFAIDVALIEGTGTEIANNLRLFVTDSSNTESSVSVSYGDLSILGPNLIPFSTLSGGADLTSVDIIRLEAEVLTASTTITIDSISVVPEPSVNPIPEPASLAIWGGGPVVIGLIGLATRRRRR